LYDDATDNSIEWSGPLSLTSAEGYVLISDTVDDFQHFETWKGTLVEYDGEILILNHPYHTIYAVVTLNSLS
jgi:hypothetical protein